jgi:hypothetical protein
LGRVQAEEQTDLLEVLLHLALFRLLVEVMVLLTQLLQLVVLVVQVVERGQIARLPEEVETRLAHLPAKVIMVAQVILLLLLMEVVAVVVQQELAQTVLLAQAGLAVQVQRLQLQELL